MRFAMVPPCLLAVLAAALLLSGPQGASAKTTGCKKPSNATTFEHNRQSVVFMKEYSLDETALKTTFYGCSNRVDKLIWLWKCDAGQMTSDELHDVILKSNTVTLEIERDPEDSGAFHLTRTVNLRTGKRQDHKSPARPGAPNVTYNC